MDKFKLNGKTALVTGSNTGIGLGIAKGLAKAGAKIAIHGRDEEKNKEALEEIIQIHDGCKSFSFDFLDIEGLSDFYTEVSGEMNGIDILVNNAGTQSRGRADKVSLKQFNKVIDINLTAPYFLSQSFAKEHNNSDSSGNIIMIASLMSEAARKTTSPYTASKGGIRQLIKALAVDWADFDIRVNGLGPGYIHTDMTDSLYQDEEFDAWVKGRTPLGRWGKPEDFEGAAVFLASEASNFINGQILYVDGGWLATF
jgi:gluconate 5-dehydrogenase